MFQSVKEATFLGAADKAHGHYSTLNGHNNTQEGRHNMADIQTQSLFSENLISSDNSLLSAALASMAANPPNLSDDSFRNDTSGVGTRGQNCGYYGNSQSDLHKGYPGYKNGKVVV